MGGFDDIRGCVRISIVEEDCRKIGDRTEFVDFKLYEEFIKNHQSSSEFEHFDPLQNFFFVLLSFLNNNLHPLAIMKSRNQLFPHPFTWTILTMIFRIQFIRNVKRKEERYNRISLSIIYPRK